jgi:hypothetical protein
MNFINNNLIIWIILYIGATLFLYFYGIRSDWQELRKKYGLEIVDNKNPPRFCDKFILGEKHYYWLCFKLMFLTFIQSAIIMLAFYYTTSTKEINNVLNFISVLLSLFFVYAVLIGAPLKKEKDFKNDANKDRVYEKTVYVIGIFKKKFIECIVKSEHQFLQEVIANDIEEWYKTDYKLKIGALIVRINSDFFNEILPEDTDKSIKEEMKDMAYKLLMLYDNNDQIMIDHLQKLFKYKIIENKAKIADIANFIKNCQLTAPNIKQADIDKYIKQQKTFKSSRNKRVKTMDELNSVIKNIDISSVYKR